MRHNVKKRHFNRDTKHRKALLMNLVRALIEHGEITTTKAKAKEVKRLSDKLIYRATKGDVTSRRVLHRYFGKRDVVNTLVDTVAPLMKDRVSGYTTITSLGKRRGDNTEMAKLSLVVKPETSGSLKKPVVKKEKPVKTKKKEKEQSPAKKTPAKKATTKKTSVKKPVAKKKVTPAKAKKETKSTKKASKKK